MDIVVFVVISSIINLVLAGLLIFYVIRQYNRNRETEKELRSVLKHDDSSDNDEQ